MFLWVYLGAVGMSYDLKSQLTSIRAYSEALRDGVANTPAQRQRYIETICRKEQEIEEMVERLLRSPNST